IVPLRSLGQDFLYFVIDKITVVDTLNNDIDYKIEFWHGDSIVNVKRAKFKQHDVYLCESIPANSQLIIYVNKNAYKIDSLVKYIGYSTKVRLIMFYRGHSDCYSLTSNVPYYDITTRSVGKCKANNLRTSIGITNVVPTEMSSKRKREKYGSYFFYIR